MAQRALAGAREGWDARGAGRGRARTGGDDAEGIPDYVGEHKRLDTRGKCRRGQPPALDCRAPHGAGAVSDRGGAGGGGGGGGGGGEFTRGEVLADGIQLRYRGPRVRERLAAERGTARETSSKRLARRGGGTQAPTLVAASLSARQSGGAGSGRSADPPPLMSTSRTSPSPASSARCSTRCAPASADASGRLPAAPVWSCVAGGRVKWAVVCTAAFVRSFSGAACESGAAHLGREALAPAAILFNLGGRLRHHDPIPEGIP